jgi:hypothetical protein
MSALATGLRKALGQAIGAARELADEGAREALESLAVGQRTAHAGMSPQDQALRKRLRAHARQLGDERAADGAQTTRRLVREVAYEHWHRMLFARFLAENALLIEPAHGVAVTLEEVQDLARARDEDPWELGARMAQDMLPAIFRPDDPALAVTLPPLERQKLEQLLADLPSDVFTSDDALGWTYQFWQAAEKDAVNQRAKSGEKITGETLPAVTQLFTEPYMVHFLLHNTLGAWHAARVLAQRPELAEFAQSEDELRRAVALPGCELEYLRFVRSGPASASENDGDEAGPSSGPWRPAAGDFLTWPARAAELRVLDPCCGSGHFLVAAFDLLVRLRMHEDGLALEPAIRAVLSENLHGLELDPRCTQIAAFHLALAAWRWAGRPIDLPPLAVACCGLGPAASKDEWLAMAEAAAAAGGMPAKRDLYGKQDSLLSDALRAGFEALHEMFARASELGSLIDPSSLPKDMYHAKFEQLEPLLERMLTDRDDERRERAVAAAGMARAARILVGPPGGYTLVVTNVPYLGRKSHTDELKAWIDEHHKDAKNDLATVFVSRTLRWVGRRGTVAAVTPQTWLFLTSFRKLRERLLEQQAWNLVVRLGEHAFESSAAAGAFVAIVVITGAKPGEDHNMAGADVSASRGQRPIYSREKAAMLRGDLADIGSSNDNCDGSQPSEPDTSSDGSILLIPQSEQPKNPDARIAFSAALLGPRLGRHAKSFLGLGTGDFARFGRHFWEFVNRAEGWSWHQGPVEKSMPWGGAEYVLAWDETVNRVRGMKRAEREQIHNQDQSGQQAWGRPGVAVSLMGELRVSLFSGSRYDKAVAVLVPDPAELLPALWVACNDDSFNFIVREVDRNVMCSNGALVKIPFALARWQSVAVDRYPRGLPEPQSNDPTQWLFHGHPAGMLAAGLASASPFCIGDSVGADRHPSLICRKPNAQDVLQVAVARLAGYRWPAEHEAKMRLDVAARAWVERCSELDAFRDADGIVCIPSLRGEPAAAERLRALLAAALAEAPGGFTAARERELLAAAAGSAKPAESLDAWLRERFFEEHCALFHGRPFVWHVWDGRKDGFSALVHYHRLAGPDGEGRRVLEALAFSYLGEWIDRQKAERAEGREGADGRMEAALRLQGELAKILAGEPPYDLFVRWKPLQRQPLGWEPDLDDGVRLNLRPFLSAADLGRKGSGLLRVRPKSVKWTLDRGKEPESLRPRDEFPWFWSCDPDERPAHRTDFGSPATGGAPAGAVFDGKRWNDLHYTRAAKGTARAGHASEARS